jgi:4-amino-4-deoxy-L-arabinose transferase-like glycosyltransferase
MFLGKTLEAARLTIGLWTLLGLAGLIWVGFELKNKWIGLFTALLLYLIPTYYNQTLILQSDILVPAISTLSLGALLRFLNTKNERWFYFSVILMTCGFWVKFDVSLIPVAIVTMFAGFKKGIISVLLAIFCSLLIIIPFGIKDVITNVVTLRLQAVSETQSPTVLLEYLIKEPFLLIFILGSIFLLFVNIKRLHFITVILLVWNISFLLILSVYHPLFPHHLSMITVPVALIFSYLLFNLIGKNQRLMYGLTSFVLIIVVGIRLYTVAKTPSTLIQTDQRTALKIINSYTTPEDLIVTDEEILNILSGRLPPRTFPKLNSVAFRLRTAEK